MRSERTFIHQLKDGHVLNENGSDTSLPQVVQKMTDVVEFIVIKNGVDRHIDLHAKWTGILTELPDILNTVACRRTSPETRSPDIDRIGAMVDSRHTALQVLGRSQQFK